MKRKLIRAASLVLTLIVCVTGASSVALAHGGCHGKAVKKSTCRNVSCKFADADKDGICDNCDKRHGKKGVCHKNSCGKKCVR